MADALGFHLLAVPRSSACYGGGAGPDQYRLEEWLEDFGFRRPEVPAREGADSRLHPVPMVRLCSPDTARMDPETRTWHEAPEAADAGGVEDDDMGFEGNSFGLGRGLAR